MRDIKQNIARNIAEIRKALNLTQNELAERLNYSDKAVSKWERGESLPDITILKQIADMGGVTVDFLLEEQKGKANEVLSIPRRNRKRNHLIITLLSCSLIWLIATIIFVSLGIYRQHLENLWIIFVYAVPITMVVLLVFNSLWGMRKLNFVIITIMVWSILIAIYLSLKTYQLSLIFVIGIPAQIIIFLWSGFHFDCKKGMTRKKPTEEKANL